MNNPTHSPTTSLPCPRWCTRPAGHGFDTQTDDGVLIRYHEHIVGRITYADRYDMHLSPAVPFVPTTIDVRIIAEERAASNDGPVLSTTVPWIDSPGCHGLDGISAREFLALLDEAADRWARFVDGEAIDEALELAARCREATS